MRTDASSAATVSDQMTWVPNQDAGLQVYALISSPLRGDESIQVCAGGCVVVCSTVREAMLTARRS